MWHRPALGDAANFSLGGPGLSGFPRTFLLDNLANSVTSLPIGANSTNTLADLLGFVLVIFRKMCHVADVLTTLDP
jgi:hypothetical protein